MDESDADNDCPPRTIRTHSSYFEVKKYRHCAFSKKKKILLDKLHKLVGDSDCFTLILKSESDQFTCYSNDDKKIRMARDPSRLQKTQVIKKRNAILKRESNKLKTRADHEYTELFGKVDKNEPDKKRRRDGQQYTDKEWEYICKDQSGLAKQMDTEEELVWSRWEQKEDGKLKLVSSQLINDERIEKWNQEKKKQREKVRKEKEEKREREKQRRKEERKKERERQKRIKERRKRMVKTVSNQYHAHIKSSPLTLHQSNRSSGAGGGLQTTPQQVRHQRSFVSSPLMTPQSSTAHQRGHLDRYQPLQFQAPAQPFPNPWQQGRAPNMMIVPQPRQQFFQNTGNTRVHPVDSTHPQQQQQQQQQQPGFPFQIPQFVVSHHINNPFNSHDHPTMPKQPASVVRGWFQHPALKPNHTPLRGVHPSASRAQQQQQNHHHPTPQPLPEWPPNLLFLKQSPKEQSNTNTTTTTVNKNTSKVANNPCCGVNGTMLPQRHNNNIISQKQQQHCSGDSQINFCVHPALHPAAVHPVAHEPNNNNNIKTSASPSTHGFEHQVLRDKRVSQLSLAHCNPHKSAQIDRRNYLKGRTQKPEVDIVRQKFHPGFTTTFSTSTSNMTTQPDAGRKTKRPKVMERKKKEKREKAIMTKRKKVDGKTTTRRKRKKKKAKKAVLKQTAHVSKNARQVKMQQAPTSVKRMTEEKRGKPLVSSAKKPTAIKTSAGVLKLRVETNKDTMVDEHDGTSVLTTSSTNVDKPKPILRAPPSPQKMDKPDTNPVDGNQMVDEEPVPPSPQKMDKADNTATSQRTLVKPELVKAAFVLAQKMNRPPSSQKMVKDDNPLDGNQMVDEVVSEKKLSDNNKEKSNDGSPPQGYSFPPQKKGKMFFNFMGADEFMDTYKKSTVFRTAKRMVPFLTHLPGNEPPAKKMSLQQPLPANNMCLQQPLPANNMSLPQKQQQQQFVIPPPPPPPQQLGSIGSGSSSASKFEITAPLQQQQPFVGSTSAKIDIYLPSAELQKGLTAVRGDASNIGISPDKFAPFSNDVFSPEPIPGVTGPVLDDSCMDFPEQPSRDTTLPTCSMNPVDGYVAKTASTMPPIDLKSMIEEQTAFKGTDPLQPPIFEPLPLPKKSTEIQLGKWSPLFKDQDGNVVPPTPLETLSAAGTNVEHNIPGVVGHQPEEDGLPNEFVSEEEKKAFLKKYKSSLQGYYVRLEEQRDHVAKYVNQMKSIPKDTFEYVEVAVKCQKHRNLVTAMSRYIKMFRIYLIAKFRNDQKKKEDDDEESQRKKDEENQHDILVKLAKVLIENCAMCEDALGPDSEDFFSVFNGLEPTLQDRHFEGGDTRCLVEDLIDLFTGVRDCKPDSQDDKTLPDVSLCPMDDILFRECGKRNWTYPAERFEMPDEDDWNLDCGLILSPKSPSWDEPKPKPKPKPKKKKKRNKKKKDTTKPAVGTDADSFLDFVPLFDHVKYFQDQKFEERYKFTDDDSPRKLTLPQRIQRQLEWEGKHELAERIRLQIKKHRQETQMYPYRGENELQDQYEVKMPDEIQSLQQRQRQRRQSQQKRQRQQSRQSRQPQGSLSDLNPNQEVIRQLQEEGLRMALQLRQQQQSSHPQRQPRQSQQHRQRQPRQSQQLQQQRQQGQYGLMQQGQGQHQVPQMQYQQSYQRHPISQVVPNPIAQHQLSSPLILGDQSVEGQQQHNQQFSPPQANLMSLRDQVHYLNRYKAEFPIPLEVQRHLMKNKDWQQRNQQPSRQFGQRQPVQHQTQLPATPRIQTPQLPSTPSQVLYGIPQGSTLEEQQRILEYQIMLLGKDPRGWDWNNPLVDHQRPLEEVLKEKLEDEERELLLKLNRQVNVQKPPTKLSWLEHANTRDPKLPLTPVQPMEQIYPQYYPGDISPVQQTIIPEEEVQQTLQFSPLFTSPVDGTNPLQPGNNFNTANPGVSVAMNATNATNAFNSYNAVNAMNAVNAINATNTVNRVNFSGLQQPISAPQHRSLRPMLRHPPVAKEMSVDPPSPFMTAQPKRAVRWSSSAYPGQSTMKVIPNKIHHKKKKRKYVRKTKSITKKKKKR